MECLSQPGLLQQSTPDWAAYKQQILISHSLEPGSPRSGCQQIQYLVRAVFLVHSQCLFTVSSHGERQRELSHHFYVDTNPFHEVPPPDLPKAPPPSTVTVGVRISQVDLGGHPHPVRVTGVKPSLCAEVPVDSPSVSLSMIHGGSWGVKTLWVEGPACFIIDSSIPAEGWVSE